MHRIFAIDPGVTTGYCFASFGENGRLVLTPGENRFSLDAFYIMLESICKVQDDNVHIIYEDFQYRNYARMGLDLTPVKVIGIIELMQERYEPFVTFTKQSAATGKAFYSDDRLKTLGIYPKGVKHGRDAMRHLLQWLNFGGGGQYINVNEVQMELALEES